MKLLKLKQVIEITGLSRASIYRLIEDEKFPKQVRISARRVAWKNTDIESWIEQQTSY